LKHAAKDAGNLVREHTPPLSPLLTSHHPRQQSNGSWHESSPIYSCDFQPLPAAQLKRLLAIANDEEEGKGPGPLIAGGRQYRLATAGGDSKVRVSHAVSPFYSPLADLPVVDGLPKHSLRLGLCARGCDRPRDRTLAAPHRIPHDSIQTYRPGQRGQV
jgi:hypothetical protein